MAKLYFTLVSVTMKWINLWIENFKGYIFRYEISFNLLPQQLFLRKAKNLRESRKRNMILKCLCPHVGCAPSQWENDVPLLPSLEILPFCPN